MSNIVFRSLSGHANVSGAERARAQLLCADLFFAALGVGTFSDAKLYRKLLPSNAYPLGIALNDNPAFLQSFRTYCGLSLGDNSLIMPGTGERINPVTAAFNTAVVGGSDAIRLLTKLHAQCESHCYVEGEHRSWLADMIEQGVEDCILRDGMGWQDVVTLLRAGSEEPVVTSFSGTASFPNFVIARDYGKFDAPLDRLTSDDLDHWYELPIQDRWAAALNGLRECNKKAKLEINPETLATQGYGNGISGFDIYAALRGES